MQRKTQQAKNELVLAINLSDYIVKVWLSFKSYVNTAHSGNGLKIRFCEL